MTTFVVGHGSLEADKEETTVPEGGSITFYTEVDYDIVLAYGLMVVAQGDAGSGYPVAAGQPVQNYKLNALTDNQRVRYETVAQEGLNVVYVGDTRLFDGIHLCEGDQTMCSGGRHICGGVFGRIDDPDIVYVACRGLEDAPVRMQPTYGSTGESFAPDREQELLSMSEEDRGRALCTMEDARDPEQQETLAYLMNIEEMRKAAYKERARQYLSTEPESFLSMFLGQPPLEQGWMAEVAEVDALLKQNGIELVG